jgi:hypothetical protein
VLVVRSKPVKEVFAGFNAEGVGVLRKVTVLEHVVDIVPNSFELTFKSAWCLRHHVGYHLSVTYRDAEFAVVVYHLFSFAPVLVSLELKSVHGSKPM